MCRGTAPANSSSSGTKLRPSPEARSEASTGTPDVPCTCRPAAATSSMHRNISRMQQKSSQNLQQPRAIEINCAAMTWSERSELRVSAGAYTLVYVSRRYTELALSDTRHTSFYATTQGCYIFIRAFMPPLRAALFYGIGAGSLLSCAAAPP